MMFGIQIGDNVSLYKDMFLLLMLTGDVFLLLWQLKVSIDL